MNKQIKKIVKKSGSSFFWGMHILPTKERRAIYTLYAFCRHIDDIVVVDENGRVCGFIDVQDLPGLKLM